MKPDERRLFRANLLQQLDIVAPWPLELPQLRKGAILGGFTVGDQELLAELDYLIGKALVEQPAKTVSPEIGSWKISAVGRDFAAANPLA